MAKKKVTPKAEDTKNDALESQNHKTLQPTTMDDPSEKLQNLKSLNSLLLKETFDRRQQVESLVQAKDGLESELSKLAMANKLLESELTRKSEENAGLAMEKNVFCVFVSTQMAQMVKEKAEIERLKSEQETQVALLKREVNELTSSLENEKGELRRVCWESDVVKSDFDGLAEEANGLRLKVVEMEKRERFIEDEVEKFKMQCERLGQEKAEKERVVQAVMREKDLAERNYAELERVIGDLKREIEEIVREKDGIEKEKRGQEVRIFQLEKEVGNLNKIELDLRTEKEALHMKALQLEKSVGDALGKEEEMERKIEALVEEKREKEHTVERLNEEMKSQKALLNMVTEELKSEIAELNREVGEQRDVIFTLRNACSEQKEKNDRLVSEVTQYKDTVDHVIRERAEAEKSLDEEKKKVEDLKLLLSGREKTIVEIQQELTQLMSERLNITEKNKEMETLLESLVKEKDVMKKSLSEAQRKVHDWKAKSESARFNLDQALTMLKNTAAVVSSQSEGKKEVGIKERKCGEEIQPYAVELETIQKAFRNKEKMVEDMKKQLESLHLVTEAHKRKSFWTLVSSATTILAAASVAYAAKGR